MERTRATRGRVRGMSVGSAIQCSLPETLKPRRARTMKYWWLLLLLAALAAGGVLIWRQRARSDSPAPGVKRWGAVGDGQSDDTEAIQRAIEAAPDQGVVFPRGEYRI